MRKTIAILFTWTFTWVAFTSMGQTFDKKTILTKYSRGNALVELINESDVVELGRELNNTANLDRFISIIRDKKHKADSVIMVPSIYFDPSDNVFVFTIYAGKFIDNGTDWGLFDYLFVIELRITSQVGIEDVIKQTILINDETKLKSWWQSLMKSYNTKRFLRDEWASKFGLVPPPPPAPRTTDWFKG